MTPPKGETLIQLLRPDPDLGAGIPAAEWSMALRHVVGTRHDVDAGPWNPIAELDRHGKEAFALLVVDGLLMREVAIDERITASLVGAGDLLDGRFEAPTSVPAAVQWTATVPTVIAILDERMLVALRHWPTLAARLCERLAAQHTRTMTHAAINAVPRVELRVLAMLWHLGELWGRVSPLGVHLPLRLTHEALGRLVGAQRSTITLALSALGEQDAVHRRRDGSFLLMSGSQDRLAPSEDFLRRLREPFERAAAVGSPGITMRVPVRAPRSPVGEDADFEVVRARLDRLTRTRPQRQLDIQSTIERSGEAVRRSMQTRADVIEGRADRQSRRRRSRPDARGAGSPR